MQFLLLKRKKFSQYNFRMIIFQRNVFTCGDVALFYGNICHYYRIIDK